MPDKDLEERKIYTSIIVACAKLRKFAKLGQLSLDITECRGEFNKNLIDYIEYCGRDVFDFFKEYLSNLQPYMIREMSNSQKSKKAFICAIDNVYQILICVKKECGIEKAIISFPESNVRMKYFLSDQETVPVFADSITGHLKDKNIYEVKVFIQRGMKVLPLTLHGAKYQDVFAVSKKDIEDEFMEYCCDYIRDLYTSNLDLDFEKVEALSMLKQIPHTNYGKETFLSISLLIDSLIIQSNFISKCVADFALITFIQNLSLTKGQRDETKTLLDEKFKNTDIMKGDVILKRVLEQIN